MNRILRQVVEGLALCPAAVCHQIQKRPVHAAIFGEFGVKRRRHRFPLTDGDRIVAFGRDYFDSGTDAFDPGRADKNHLYRGLAEFALTDRAVHLAAIGIAADSDI